MELFDSYLHLDDDAFDGDRDTSIARAPAAGVVGMVRGLPVEVVARATAANARRIFRV